MRSFFRIVLTFAFMLCVHGQDEEECHGGEWGNYYGPSNSCYMVARFPNGNINHHEAKTICQSMGAKVVEINTQEELTQLGLYINNTLGLKGHQTFWIDAWMGAQHPQYPERCYIMTNWPNRNIDSAIYTNNNWPCTTVRPWICEGDRDHVNTMYKEDFVASQLTVLTNQLISQNLFAEERIRSDGDSGLKQIRHLYTGTRPYHADTHTSNKVASIHDHTNNIRTVGLGEFVAVLNGVEFRTRHNDYRLNMPSTDGDFNKVEPVPFPEVPPSVSNKATLNEQIVEMREYFRAWATQNTRIRDYRPYFKPIMCYLEGGWTSNTGSIDEPFYSDRHFLDASSWADLQQKVRFTAFTGRKSNAENYSYLPVRIQKLINDTFPVFAQWNYRILCHPLSRDLPLNRMRLVDDLASRMAWKKTISQHANTRAARFELNPRDTNAWPADGIFGPRRGLLDKIMEEIPGRDNYPANITDTAFGNEAFKLSRGNEKLNAGYYHRWYKVTRPDAMGLAVRSRGFSDDNVFVALTNQEKISSLEVEDCQGRGNNRVCTEYSQRATYAIPLEIIYLTPLHSWNPYNLPYKGNPNTPEGRTVNANGRNGGKNLARAFNGTNSKTYYQTPIEFFTGDEVGKNPADTARGSVGVLDDKGALQIVRASGTRIFFPKIEGLGVLRQRYPIMPVHGEGSGVWREFAALKDIVFNPNKYRHMFPDEGNPPPATDVQLEIGLTTQDPPGAHVHTITLTGEQDTDLHNGQAVTVFCSSDNGHSHQVKLRFGTDPQTNDPGQYYIEECDSRVICWDGHPTKLAVIPNGGQDDEAYDTGF